MTDDHPSKVEQIEEDLHEQADRAAVAFHPPLMLLVLIVVGIGAQWLFDAAFLPAELGATIGIPIVAASLFIFGWAISTMIRGGASVPTNTATDAIVSVGPFKLTRNPIYLSMALLLVGIGFWSNSLWFVSFAVVAILLLTRYVIQPEEHYLESKFGETYLRYKNKVRRWI